MDIVLIWLQQCSRNPQEEEELPRVLAVRAERNAHVNIKCVTGINDVSAT